MSRWIEADAVKEALKQNTPQYMWGEVLTTVNVQPYIDLVRCVECRHLEVLNERQLYAVCQRHKIAFGSFEDDTRTHGCSWGERKENE